MVRLITLLLPALIPSWRFFKAVQPSPRIEWRIKGRVWRELSPLPRRLSFAHALGRLAWNPRWNEELYLVSLSERLIATEDPFAYAELTRRIAARTGRAPAETEFRLVFLSRKREDIRRDVLFWSGEA